MCRKDYTLDMLSNIKRLKSSDVPMYTCTMSCVDDDDIEAVVVDNGSWMIKAGYAGDKTARAYERTMIGRITDESSNEISTYIGDRAYVTPGCCLSWPMDRGAIVDWDEMDRIWDYVFTHELKDGVKDRPMLITEVPGNHPSNRQKMVEILMEKYQIQSLYITDPGSLAIISSGRITGIVLDVGGSTTHVSALYEGKNLLYTNDAGGESYQSPWRSDIGGNDVTKYLHHIVCNKPDVDVGIWNSDRHFLEFDTLKDRLVCQGETRSYAFRDGTEVVIDNDLLGCCDVLFEPQRAGLDKPGVDKLLKDAIQSCEDNVKEELYSNVLLSGGTTFCNGFTDKIACSLKDDYVASKNFNVRVIAPPERKKSSWLGGSIIASLDIFPTLCKSRQTYYDKGVAEFCTFTGLDCLKALC